MAHNIDMYREDSLPILLTLHVRSNNLEQQLENLCNSRIRKLYISIDGPRNSKDIALQIVLKEIISRYKSKFSEVHLQESKHNQGIAVALISAIDWFFSHEQCGAIFEDDIEFNDESLGFFQTALKRIVNQPNILMVSGFQPFPNEKNNSDVVFTNYPQIWGWATTATKWMRMKEHLFKLPKSPKSLRRTVRNYWKLGWDRVHAGYVDTWDLPIAAGMLFSNELCMLPPVNLTSNVGVDSFSTNTVNNKFPMGLKIEKIPRQISFSTHCNPTEITKLNRMFEEELYYVSYKHLFIPLYKPLDKLRFQSKKKEPLLLRINSFNVP